MANGNPDDAGAPYHSTFLYHNVSGHSLPSGNDYTLFLFPSAHILKRRMAM